MAEMRKIEAFVAHSFLKADKALIDKFLEYLSSLKNILNWENAKDTQPSCLSEKVMEIMKDKDVFIGIFTRKYLIRRLLNDKWLPSLWIVQESGYAVGKKMKLIFLVEKGVDKNDFEGLHADYELIFFSRKDPEKCFEKINQMILEIFKSVSKIELISTQKKQEDDQKKEGGKNIEDEKEDLEFHFMKAMYKDDQHQIDETFNKLIEKSENEEEKCKNECWKFYLYHSIKKQNVLKDLDNLEKKYPKYPSPHIYRGDVLKDMKEYKKAIDSYEKAKEISTESSKKLKVEIKISQVKRESFDYAGLENRLNTLLETYEDNDSRSYLYEELGFLFLEKDKDRNKAINCFEKVIDLKPENINIRFTIAYQYSELGNNEKALYYYKTYSDNEDNPTVFNNLGVAYQLLGMPIKAVSYYKKSMEKKETLAMANLANKYLNEGFVEEAEKILNEASAYFKPHENVIETKSRLNSLREKEEKKEKEIINNIIKSKLVQ